MKAWYQAFMEAKQYQTSFRTDTATAKALKKIIFESENKKTINGLLNEAVGVLIFIMERPAVYLKILDLMNIEIEKDRVELRKKLIART